MTEKSKIYQTSNLNITRAFTIILLIICSDQASKYFILKLFESNAWANHHQVLPFFNLSIVWNYGISFGIFNQLAQHQIILILLSFSISIALIFWLLKSGDKTLELPISMVIGGAYGNVIDRIHYGAVFDFLDFHIARYHYPAFNVADSFIVIGGFLLVLCSKKSKNT